MCASLLAVLAHPDDESFAIGGTLAKYAHSSVRVTLVTASRGELSTLGEVRLSPEELAVARERELIEAAAVLGITELRILGYPDSGLSRIPSDELSGRISEIIDEVRPNVILTFDHYGFTGHADHQVIHEATTRAFEQERQASKTTASRLFYWVVPEWIAADLRSTRGVDFRGADPQDISAVIDIREYRAIQHAAIRQHRSQTTPLVSVLSRRLALQDGFEYFHLVGERLPQPIDDLFAGLPGGTTK